MNAHTRVDEGSVEGNTVCHGVTVACGTDHDCIFVCAEARKGAFRIGYEFYGQFAMPFGGDVTNSKPTSRWGQGTLKLKITDAYYCKDTLGRKAMQPLYSCPAGATNVQTSPTAYATVMECMNWCAGLDKPGCCEYKADKNGGGTGQPVNTCTLREGNATRVAPVANIATSSMTCNDKLRLTIFAVATHGEDCDRKRKSGTGAAGLCSNAGCACRDPGVTSYYMKGTATKNQLTVQLANMISASGLNRGAYSGITDRGNWGFVPKGFVANIKYVDGNTVLEGSDGMKTDAGAATGWDTATVRPGNSVGDRNAVGFQKCLGSPADCAAKGYLKLTERCYSAIEPGSFTRGDTFTGGFQCYQKGTNMAVTGTEP